MIINESIELAKRILSDLDQLEEKIDALKKMFCPVCDTILKSNQCPRCKKNEEIKNGNPESIMG